MNHPASRCISRKGFCFSARALAFSASLASFGSARAAVISGAIYESFDYPAGAFGTPNGGSGWTAAWGSGPAAGGTAENRTVDAGGLTSSATGYAQGTGGNFSVDATSGSNNIIGRSLGQTIDAGTTYFSFLINNGSTDNTATRTFALGFFSASNAEQFTIGQFGTGSTNTNRNIALLELNNFTTGFNEATTPIQLTAGTTRLVIGRIVWSAAGDETITLWVDPVDVTSQLSDAASYLTATASLTNLGGIRTFAGNTTGSHNPTNDGNIDEIRFGSTWESVTTVPEPSGAVLAGLGGLALLRRRRKP